jgi:two-component system nitrogen regulation sensor histidine kinase GlnL
VQADSEQVRHVLDLLDTGVVRLGDDGGIRFMNSAAENCLLVSRDRARGRRLAEVAPVPTELARALDDSREPGYSIRLHELRLGDALYDCTLQRARDGSVMLEFHNLQWEQMRLRLQQREVQTGMLNLLSRNLGHEVRNPLGGIRGAAQMLADELDSAELSTLARLIMRESDRIDELIQKFGQPELELRETHLYRLLDEALDVLAVDFGDTVSVERDYDPSIPPIRADASAIRQVILNLLRNACQAGARNLLIRTRVEHGNNLLQSARGSVIRLAVVDDGEGVPESLRSLLFLPLVTGRRDGTGLGLSLSQQIASAHGGLLTFEPRERGSCFSLFLPLAGGSAEQAPENLHEHH